MTIDAIIISDSGSDSLSATNPLKLTLDNRIADIQVVQNFLIHAGRVQLPIEGDGVMSWTSAPKLNGIYLFNYLLKHKFAVELIDNFHKEKDRFKMLLTRNPRAVIISTTFIPGKQSLCKLVMDVCDLAPDVFIIVGGPLVYLSYLMLKRSNEMKYDTQSAKNDFLFLEIKNEPEVDLYLISLRGEQLLCDALDNIRKNKGVEGIPNSARLIGNAYHFTRRIDDITGSKDLSIDWLSLPDTIFKSGVVPMQASNGCPYHCAFCNFTKDRRLTWIKPLDLMLAEMKVLKKRGVRYVWFVDDNFRLGKGKLEAICRRFVDENLGLFWMTFIRADTLENVDPELLRRAGCIEVQLGLESADSQILKNMNKKVTSELYHKVLKRLLSAGINCSCYFIFGFPGENRESIQNTRDFIKAYDYQQYKGTLTWSMFPFILAPLSPIYESEARNKYGISGYLHKWQHATMNSDQARNQLVKTFFEIKNSGPIYRGDNQDIFRCIGPFVRRKFEAARHNLAKVDLKGQLDKNEIMQVFSEVLSE